MQGWQECRRQFGSSGWLSGCAVAHLSRPNFTGDCLYWHMYHRNVRVECARSTHSSIIPIIRPFKCACQRKLPLRRPQPKLLQGCMPPVTDCWCQTTPASKALSLQKGRDSKESLYHFLQSFYELLQLSLLLWCAVPAPSVTSVRAPKVQSSGGFWVQSAPSMMRVSPARHPTHQEWWKFESSDSENKIQRDPEEK